MTKFTTDMLYYSPYPEVVNDYLQEKISQGGRWINIFGEERETKIVSPSSITLDEYLSAWLLLTGDCYRLETRYRAMTNCPLLVNLFGICEL